VRIRRSRNAWSPVFRYCRHIVRVSSGRLTSKRIRRARDFSSAPEGRKRQGAEPARDRERRQGDQPAPHVGSRAGDCSHGDCDQSRSEAAEEGTECALLHAPSVFGSAYEPECRKRPGTIRAPRGVAQLAEHRSPKPGVAGSSPAAPAGFVTLRLYLSRRLLPAGVRACSTAERTTHRAGPSSR
jgi:hypothetical protein